MKSNAVNEIVDYYNLEVKMISKNYKKLGQGAVRDLMGKLYQRVCEMIIKSVDPSLEIKSNDYLTLHSKSKKYKLDNIQVDWHVYRKDTLVLIIECKTYLDVCYLKRAIEDFETIRKVQRNVPAVIFSGQNAVGQNAWDFYNDEYRFDCFFINTEKRRSKNPVYKSCDPLDTEEIRRFAEYVRKNLQ